jgi:hypothetical protein|uniref:Uncharacterized protein n=1 Tax=viral metagenome TaxID=1070528 RepID=A0A6C0AH67_9ZZZZ
MATNSEQIVPDVNLGSNTGNPIHSIFPRRFTLQFTNNAMVYYKSHSLSVGGGGSGVRNARHKKRKT